ncbi:MAG: sensor histidine kinase [Pseudonocardiaceae bacterium]
MADTVRLLAGFGSWPAVLAAAVVSAVAVGGGVFVALAGRRTIRRHQTELARLQQALERRAEHVAALSHELRTPLSMIQAAVELLLEESRGAVNHDQRKLLRAISVQSEQVIGLCEGLLIQAKIDAGVFVPRRELIDISALAWEVVVAMRPLCAQRNQRITLDTPQVTREISADPAHMLQVLTNLLSNANRYTSDGGSISVRVMEVDDGVAVYVTDDGRGMTREQRHQLFRRFVTGRPLEDGTGLGLVITKAIVEAHGGTILVDTTAHRGTTFLFTMPTTSMPTAESR